MTEKNKKVRYLAGLAEAPLGVLKRHSNLRLHSKERMTGEQFSDWLAGRIRDGIPTAAVRFGSIELHALASEERTRLFSKKFPQEAVDRLCNQAGFFPPDKSFMPDFYQTYVDVLPEVDAIGNWDVEFERYFIHTYMKNPVQTELEYLEPYNTKNPWTKALEGKRVLVIHPFIQSIRSQYENHRTQLFADPDVLPQFELRTLKAVQTIAGTTDSRFKTWFEALDYMEQEALKIDFDVAIIGCGAYGMPLALRLKKAGKIAIHLGGATQILFGVYGKRWEQQGSTLINEHWIKPSMEERPAKFSSVEQGCYW